MESYNAFVSALGGKRYGKGYRAHCPAHDDQHPSLDINQGHDGKILTICRTGCSQQQLISKFKEMEIWPYSKPGFNGFVSTFSYKLSRDAYAKNRKEKSKKMAWCRDQWRSGLPIPNTLAEIYLRQERGLGNMFLPSILRYTPSRFHYETKKSYPALIAPISLWPNKTVIGIHSIYLDPMTGKKANVMPAKRSSGQLSGAAVRLAPLGRELGITEGIEDALTVMKVLGIPCWAALGSNLQSVIVPEPGVVHHISIFADNGEGGERLAKNLERRLLSEGHRVRVVFPLQCKDFNEALNLAGDESCGGDDE